MIQNQNDYNLNVSKRRVLKNITSSKNKTNN